MSGVDLLPAWPTSGDSEAAFNTKADALGPALSTMITQINTALGVTNISAWVSGAAYTAGTSVVWSPINFQAYRRKTTSSAGTTDPSIDTTNWSPVSSVTAPQFDNDTSIATTAFVQRALGNMQTTLYAASTTLTAADAGKAVLLATTGTVMTLPLLSSVPLGSVFRFVNVTTNGAGSVARQGGDVIYFGATALPSIAVNGGESLDVVAHATGWVAIGGSMSLAYASSSFGASLAANGYQKLPSGMIIQWGSSSAISSGSQLTITLPIAMPSALLRVFATAETSTSDTTPVSGGWSSVSTSQFVLRNKSTAASLFSWMAIGY